MAGPGLAVVDLCVLCIISASPGNEGLWTVPRRVLCHLPVAAGPGGERSPAAAPVRPEGVRLAGVPPLPAVVSGPRPSGDTAAPVAGQGASTYSWSMFSPLAPLSDFKPP